MCCASKEVGNHCLTICSLITKRNSFNIFFLFFDYLSGLKKLTISFVSFFFTERSFCEAPGSAAQLPAYRPFHVQSEFLFAVTFSLFLYDKNNKSKKKKQNKKTTLSPSAATLQRCAGLMLLFMFIKFAKSYLFFLHKKLFFIVHDYYFIIIVDESYHY